MRYNTNYISYIFIYLVYTSIFVYLNTYFPILFLDVLDTNRIILALIQFLAYFIFLFRPIFAVITDKYKIRGYRRKYYILFSGYILTTMYILMGLTFLNILIFGIFLVLIFLSSTILDVSTKSLIIDTSPTSETKKRAFFFIIVGQSLGKVFPYFLYFILINDVYSIKSWTTFFICSYVLLLPLLGSLPFINERNTSQIAKNSENSNICDREDLSRSPHSKTIFILLCIFVFFAFSDAIFAYPFFPYLLTRFGTNKFDLFNFFLIFYFLLSIMSGVAGTFLIKRMKPKKIILILIPLIGIIYLSYTIVDFTLFTILYFTGSSLVTIANLNISVYIMKFKKGNKSVYYHLITSFRNLSIFIFLPLGTLLSSFISTEYLIVIGAVLLNLCIIPLIHIKI